MLFLLTNFMQTNYPTQQGLWIKPDIMIVASENAPHILKFPLRYRLQHILSIAGCVEYSTTLTLTNH
jgi:hypothetical protein